VRSIVLILGWWRSSVRGSDKVRLWEVLRRRGTSRLAHRHGRSLEFAVERCLQCRAESRCERLLEAGAEARVDAFCPNAMYLRHLDDMLRHEPKRSLLGPDVDDG